MNGLLKALMIGIIAGLLDVVPMIIQKLDKTSCWSAFIHYFILGLIIPFINWDIQPWLRGSIVALLTAIPVMIIVYPKDPKALIPMVLFAWVLGAGIGLAGAKFIK